MAGEELGDAVSHLVSQHLKDLEDAVSASERYIEEFKATKRSTFVPNPEQLAVAEEVLREVLEEHERRWAELKAGVDYVHEKLKQSFQHLTSLLGRLPDAALSVLDEFGKRVGHLEDEVATLALQAEQLSQRVSQEQLQRWGVTLNFGDALAPSEEIAKDALEWGKISQGALLEALRQLKMGKVRPGRRRGSKCIEEGADVTFGLYTTGQQGNASITNGFRENPYLVRLLTAYFRRHCEQAGVQAFLTSITVSKDLKLTDDNLGLGMLMSLGSFCGGGLHIDKHGQVDEDEEDREEVLKVSERVTKAALHLLGEGKSIHVSLRYVSRAVTLELGRTHRDKLARELEQAGMIWPSEDHIQRCKTMRYRDMQYKQACRPLRPLRLTPAPHIAESAMVLHEDEQDKQTDAARQALVKIPKPKRARVFQKPVAKKAVKKAPKAAAKVKKQTKQPKKQPKMDEELRKQLHRVYSQGWHTARRKNPKAGQAFFKARAAAARKKWILQTPAARRSEVARRFL
ncbi:unnamed protein product [Durusdinium trenchii]|uniref:Uncharacterized protein n=1 Tax=Durusdinium trenchii TaxID=1381693 RepID=A0ABP0KUR9_9DINO